MSCLVISNIQKNIVQLTRLLNKLDIQNIQYFSTAELAIQEGAVSDETVDLIFLDEVCTQSNREEITKDIGLLADWNDAPILLVTNYDKRESIEGALQAGAFDFIVKPIDLTHLQTRVHIAMKYMKETRQRKEQEKFLKQDLLIAKNVQKSALTPALHTSSIQLDGFYITSNTLGGDMYCWFKVSEYQTAIILYDVMGHGVASSLITMSIRSLLRGMMTRLADPMLVIQELNRHINELYKDEYMDSYLVTAIYLLVDTKEQKVSYVNAAHPVGFMFDEAGAVTPLSSNTLILGLLPQLTIEKQEIPITGKQRIILYTDGLQQTEEPVNAGQFHDYIQQSNEKDLQQFVMDNQLENIQQIDDISIVFITIS